MADRKQNPLVVFGLIAVIAIAVILIVRGVMSERHPVEMPPMSWICTACGFSTPPVAEPVEECPECGEPMRLDLPRPPMPPEEMTPPPPAE